MSKILKRNERLHAEMREANDRLCEAAKGEVLAAIGTFQVGGAKAINLAVAEMYMLGYSTQQICQELGTNNWGVYSRYHQAKKLLRPLLSLTGKRYLNRRVYHF